MLRDRGHLFEGTYSGLYCTACEQFYREEELVDGTFCPQHGTVPEWTEEKNHFFRLSAFADTLLAHYDAHPDFVLPRGRMNETRAFVESGLEDLSITRQGVDLGRAGAVGPDAVDLRLGRRAAQLRLGPRPTPARTRI